MTVVFAPAASSALRGSSNSASSKPSVARIATRSPFNCLSVIEFLDLFRLKQFYAAKRMSHDSLHTHGWSIKTAVQSGEGFRKKVSKINAFLTSLTIPKTRALILQTRIAD